MKINGDRHESQREMDRALVKSESTTNKQRNTMNMDIFRILSLYDHSLS